MGEDYLPPVVINIALNDAPAIAELGTFKAAVSDATTSVGGSAAKMGGAVGAAEKDIETKNSGFAGRLGGALQNLGGTLGKFGIPFSSGVSKMGADMGAAEAKGKGFGVAMAGIGRAAAGLGLALAAGIGVAAMKAADTFDVAQERLQQAVTNTKHSFSAFEPSIKKTESNFTNLGFTTAETSEALGTLTVSTHSPTKAMGEMGLAADLARYKHISLAQASETLAKVNAGSLRPLTQLGIQLDIGSLKLTAMVKATESVTKAKKELKQAEEGLVVAEKKGEEEHAAAVAKLASAQSALKGAQDALKGDSEGLKGAQEALKTAQRGVTEAAEKQRIAVKEASRALKQAEEAARETAEQGAKGVEGAKNNLSNLEKERAKESNENAIREIESQEKVLEASKSASAGAELAVLKAKKTELEAADKAQESQKKEVQLQEAHKAITEAETQAEKSNKTAVDAVTAAHEKLVKAHKEALASSRENVAAANSVATAQRGVSGAVQKLQKDQEAEARASAAVSTAQRGVDAGSKAVAAAQEKLARAHEKVSEAEKTLQRDQTSTGTVMAALKEKIGGTAAAFGTTLAGQTDIAKAKLNEIAVEIGTRLTPLLLGLLQAGKAVAAGLAPVWNAIKGGIEWVGREAANLDVAWERDWGGIRSTTEGVVKAVISTFTTLLHVGTVIWKDVAGAALGFWKVIWSVARWVGGAIDKLAGFFESLPGRVLGAVGAIATGMYEFGKNLVKNIINGILSAPGAIVNAIKGLIPGSGLIGKAASVLGLAEGGLVTKPTLAVVGEAGPEMVVPLRNIGTGEHVQPLPRAVGSPGSQPDPSSAAMGSGLSIGTVQLIGTNQSNADIVNEMYRKFRPLLQGA